MVMGQRIGYGRGWGRGGSLCFGFGSGVDAGVSGIRWFTLVYVLFPVFCLFRQILTEECLSCDQILSWWFNTRLLRDGAYANRGQGNGSYSSFSISDSFHVGTTTLPKVR